MKILYAAAENAPYAKTGGLADVGPGLAKALVQLGHEVRMVMPRYRCVGGAGVEVEGPVGNVTVSIDTDSVGGDVYRSYLPGTKGTDAEVPIDLIDRPELFDRKGLYGEKGKDYKDNLERFVYFSKAALAWCQESGWKPDVIHANDWHAALIPIYLRTDAETFFEETRVLYTIHNLAYQGLFPKDDFSILGLPWDLFHLDALEFHDRINLCKGGVIFSDVVSTVSENHSREIQTYDCGFGLDGLFLSVSHRLLGIVNGCDTDQWNPATDPAIAVRYGEADLAEAKAANKKALCEELGLDTSEDRPLMGVVSRLEELKGTDILADVAETLVENGAQLAILGTGDPALEDRLADVAKSFPGQAAVRLDYNEPLAHRIIAGSDFFLMPSRLEPCGLTQMYSLLYGTLPIVHAVGGLADTVIDMEHPDGIGNGFTFTRPKKSSFLKACERAVDLYARPEERWQAARRAMRFDGSWNRSARAYADLFEKMTGDESIL